MQNGQGRGYVSIAARKEVRLTPPVFQKITPAKRMVEPRAGAEAEGGGWRSQPCIHAS